MKIQVLSALLFAFMALGCQQDEDFIPTLQDQPVVSSLQSGDLKTVDVGEPFVMAPGDMVKVLPDGFNIYLNEITEDSRCPASVPCFWSGRAVASFAFEHKDTYFKAELATPNTKGPEDKINVFDRTFHMLEVRPLPEQPNNHIPQDVYRVRVVVNKEFISGQDN